MAGGISAWPQVGNPQDIATAGSGLTGITSGGTAFTKGAWTQLVASTTYQTSLILYQVVKPDDSTSCAIDIGIGAPGSEIALISNIVLESVIQIAEIFHLPVAIKSGSRIAVRCSTSGISHTVYNRMTLLDNTSTSDGVGSAYDTYGFVSATGCGTIVDPGASADTKGAYSQIVASVTNDLAGFFLTFDQQGHSTGSAVGDFMFDISIGASGSESPILPIWNFVVSGGGMLIRKTGIIPIPIKAGTRIAVRAKSSVTAAPDRIVGVTLVGVRQ